MTAGDTFSSSKSLINPAALLEEISGDRELLGVLIDTALNDLPAYAQKTAAFAAAGDWENTRLTAHAMKTTLAHWQAEKSHALAVGIEHACRDGRGAEAQALAPQLVVAMQEVLQALAQLKEQA